MAHDEKIQPADDITPAARDSSPAGDLLSDDELDAVAGGIDNESTSMATEWLATTLGCCTL